MSRQLLRNHPAEPDRVHRHGQGHRQRLAAGPDGLYFTDLYKDADDEPDRAGRKRPARPVDGLADRASAAEGRHAHAGAAGAGRRAVHRAEPHARAAARVRRLCAAAAEVQLPDRRLARHQREYRQLGRGACARRCCSATPSTSADEADVRFTVSVTDVREASDLEDYTGELRASLPLRITDTANGPTLSDSATMSDTPLGVTRALQATTGATSGPPARS